MKLSPKRFGQPVLATLMLASMALAACDSGGAAPTATTAPAAATNAPAAATSAPAAPAVGGFQPAAPLNASVSGTANIWHFWGSPVRRTAIRRIVAMCQQQLPNIKIAETYKPFGDLYTANTAAVAAGSGMADVIVEDRPKLPLAAKNNIESSLQKYIDRDKVDKSQYWPFTWDQGIYNNEQYGIPWETDVRVLYYDKTEFTEVGLDPNNPPKTWDELWAAADKLDKKNADGTYARIAFSPFVGNTGWDLYSKLAGYQVVNKDGSKVTVNDPKMVETFQWMKKWVDRYGGWNNLQKFQGSFTSAPNDAFMSGKVAMTVDINGYASQLKFYNPQYTGPDGKKVALDYGITNPPNNGTETSTSGGFALSMPKGGKNGDAAWEFIKCATGPTAQESWARDTYAMPGNQVAANDPVLLADPLWQFMVNAMKITQPLGGAYVSTYANYSEQVDKRQADMMSGKLDIKAGLDQAQADIDKTMSSGGTPVK